MSLCSPSLRALSRSGVSTSRTLLPFLYQTHTIQQWKPSTRSMPRRHVSSRSKADDEIPLKDVEDDVPFQNAGVNLPPAVGEVRHARKTTMTYSEREAFEKLYKTFNTQGQGRARDESVEHEELDQIADEYYEDDEEGSGKSLERAFDTVLRGSPRQANAQKDGKTQSDSDTPQHKKKLAARAEKERIRNLRLEERERVDKLLESAQTDIQLWKTLDREVFDQLRKLDLDGTPPSKKESSKPHNSLRSRPKTSITSGIDTRILFPNYPHHLLTALQILRIHFPASPLPLTILPTIKSLGRSSYALGATTQLYRRLLRTAWLQQSSYKLIDTLLTDMETNIVEFDLGILKVLDAVLREHEEARCGMLGRELQLVHGMEMWVQGIRNITTWYGVVAGRLGVQDTWVTKRVHVEKDRENVGHGDGPHFAGMAMGDAIPFVGENMQESTTTSQEESEDETAQSPTGHLLGDGNPEEEPDARAKILL